VRKNAANNEYQQRVICSSLETTSDSSLEPLEIIFSIVVSAVGHHGAVAAVMRDSYGVFMRASAK
jgi:hypothetical protein